MPTMKTKGTARATLAVRKPQQIELKNPVEEFFARYAQLNREQAGPVPTMCQPGTFAGKTLALCGAGPSLADADGRPVPLDLTDEVWAVNSAAPWLHGHGVGVTGAVAIDQTAKLLEEWEETIPEATYYIASTVDPLVPSHLALRGCDVAWFHNICGFEGEMEMYNEGWPPSYALGFGANVLGRVISLAFWMGFRRIDVYGADCCFAADGVAHANGDTVEEAYGPTATMKGMIEGREYTTRIDMLLGAVDLARKVRLAGGRIRLMGDTLPVALLGQDETFLDQVVRRTGEDHQ